MIITILSTHKSTPIFAILLFAILSLSIYPDIHVYSQSEFQLAQNTPLCENEKCNLNNELLEEPTYLFTNGFQKITVPKTTASQLHAVTHFSIPPISFEIHLPPPKTICFLV